MNSQGQINFNPDQNSNPTAIGNNWDHLEQQRLDDKKRRTTTNSELSDEQKLDHLVESSHQFNYRIKTQFPLDPFPNEFIIDIHKISLITKTFLSKDAISMPIRDINKVEVYNDFLFASIEIVNGSQTTTIQMKWLSKKQAREAQAIIQGLMVAYKSDINLGEFDSSEIMGKLKTLGSPLS